MSDHDQASRETPARAALFSVEFNADGRWVDNDIYRQREDDAVAEMDRCRARTPNYQFRVVRWLKAEAALSSPSPSVGWQDGARVKRTPDGWLVEIRHQDQSFTDIDVFEDGEIIVSEGGKDKRAHARTVREPSPPSPEPTPSPQDHDQFNAADLPYAWARQPQPEPTPDTSQWRTGGIYGPDNDQPTPSPLPSAQGLDFFAPSPLFNEPRGPVPTPEGRETVTLEQLRSIEWCHRVPGIGDTCPVCGGDGGHRHKFRRCWLGDAIERLAALTAPPPDRSTVNLALRRQVATTSCAQAQSVPHYEPCRVHPRSRVADAG
jgi:hypothetical protein